MKKINIILFILIILLPLVIPDSAFGGKITKDNYEVSRNKVDRTIVKGNIFEDNIEILNKGISSIEADFSIKGEIESIVSFKSSTLSIQPENSSNWFFSIKGERVGSYTGTITILGEVSEQIPVNINITEDSLDPLFLVDLNPINTIFTLNQKISFKVDITRLKPLSSKNISLTYLLISPNNISYILEEENITLDSSIQLLKRFNFPKDSSPGFYKLFLETKYDEVMLESTSLIEAKISFLNKKLFGIIPYWLISLTIAFIAVGLLVFYFIRRSILSKRKYKMSLDMKSLPKGDKKFLWLGKIAEKKNLAYLDPHRLTVHTIVAGATGGGKSIAAQVIIEEALKQNISVLVFDPTAQWSGMLRKCEDKRMFAYYPPFGMKVTDARGFPGNIRAVKDARQSIEVEKFFQPGHIQIFTLNKLQPKDMDIFVANVIRGIFQSDPKEYPTLKTLLVFDEVHRLLPKFGGSGEGFVQIERACREFRKWGYGVMLVSQVLSDFVGEIKANISTEIQMRTRDEGDLNRIKTKYGDEFLQSLVKASVGVGMFVNPAYNHANPYFINFRPILHNTRRLSDEELEKYNQYNDLVDDLEYQIEQLEQEKVDVFDLKMELKLVRDKIMVGNFSVVDIYLEGLKPRIIKQWQKMGKTPKKKELKLVNLEDIKKSVEEAKKEGEKARAKEAEEEKKNTIEKKDPFLELENRIVNPLTLDNGMMISSLKELKTVLPTLDEEVFKIHVNQQKNEISSWFEQISKTFAPRLKSIIDKEEMIKEIESYKGDSKIKEEPKKEVSKE
jgi:hypothetical protein